MYTIDTPGISDDFNNAWCFAGQELTKQGQGSLNWINSTIAPSLVDHLSFRLGNQIFSVLIDVVDWKGSHSLLQIERDRQLLFCQKHNLIPTTFTIRHTSAEGLVKESQGWNLRLTDSGEILNPVTLITEDNIPMSSWEVHDFGVQFVKNYLTQTGNSVTACQSMLDVDPTIWFESQGKQFFVIVRTSAYPANAPARPSNLQTIKDELMNKRGVSGGYYAHVGLANAQDPFLPNGECALPLLRGHAMYVKFTGLEAI